MSVGGVHGYYRAVPYRNCTHQYRAREPQESERRRTIERKKRDKYEKNKWALETVNNNGSGTNEWKTRFSTWNGENESCQRNTHKRPLRFGDQVWYIDTLIIHIVASSNWILFPVHPQGCNFSNKMLCNWATIAASFVQLTASAFVIPSISPSFFIYLPHFSLVFKNRKESIIHRFAMTHTDND